MKTLKLKQLKPCPCGGQLVLRYRPHGHLVHLVIKCEKCGAWYGGFTYKSKPEKKKGCQTNDQGAAEKLPQD